MTTTRPDREGRFRALYADAYPDVLAFAQRRGHPSHAEDVVAEAFLVVWRRFEEAPRDAGDARAWVFGIARHCLLNARRGLGRQDALAVRIATVAPGDEGHHEEQAAAERLDLAAAWRRLSAAEQETLSLTVFEDLTSARAARVLGISAASYRIRLMRARRALRHHLASADGEPAPAAPHRTATPMTTQMEARP